MTPNRTTAVNYAASVLRRATDWQDAQHALVDHPIYGPWLEAAGLGDEEAMLSEAQSIIREAEELLGDDLPY